MARLEDGQRSEGRPPRARRDPADPFRRESLGRRNLEMAWHARDYRRIAEIAEALRAARAAIRERALAAGGVSIIARLAQLQERPASGCVLVTPPLVGAEARGYRDDAWGRRIATLVVAREPRTKAGLWPVVAVGERAFRAYVAPPAGVRPVEGTMCGDEMNEPPNAEWFVGACEAIGRAILEKLGEVEHPAWRTDDLVSAVLAHPDDDAVHCALADAALEASRCAPPEQARPDSFDPFCF